MKTFAWACIGLMAGAGLTACSNDGTTTPDTWQPPAWFAEQARQREEVKQILQDCVTAKGWDIEVNEYGGSDANLATLPDGGKQFVEDVQSCHAEIPPEYAVTIDEAYLHDVLYPQQVDVYNCLLAQGVTPEPPPPVDVWVEDSLATNVETSGTGSWLAWDEPWMSEFLADPNHTYDDLVALELVCPQPYTAPNATSE